MEMEEQGSKVCWKAHILMFPWFAMGHITPYLHLSNELAKRGHNVSFLIPKKAQARLRPLILHPSLITFHPLTVPHVDGLPLGAETTSDVAAHQMSFIATALDLTRPEVERILLILKPDAVFFDFAHWVPEITTKLGIKSVCYSVACAAVLAMNLVPAREECFRGDRDPPLVPEVEVAQPPAGYPSTTVVLRKQEARATGFMIKEYGQGVTFFQRINTALKSADAIALRSCKEIEGTFCDYLSAQFKKPVLLTGSVLLQESTLQLDERWASWLGGHLPGSVVYCSLGSETILEKDQFQEILLGFELSGYPFLLALRPPKGFSTPEDAFPEGFEARVRGRGVVHGGWVQQSLLLKHPSVGCFVSHCGFGSMWESLLGTPQIVLLPGMTDQILSARIMSGEMEVAVEVTKDEETGWVTRESLSKAVKEVMDEESEVGKVIRENHTKWRSVLGSHAFMTAYVDNFLHQLRQLIH